jgi:hypothetical protein
MLVDDHRGSGVIVGNVKWFCYAYEGVVFDEIAVEVDGAVHLERPCDVHLACGIDGQVARRCQGTRLYCTILQKSVYGQVAEYVQIASNLDVAGGQELVVAGSVTKTYTEALRTIIIGLDAQTLIDSTVLHGALGVQVVSACVHNATRLMSRQQEIGIVVKLIVYIKVCGVSGWVCCVVRIAAKQLFAPN